MKHVYKTTPVSLYDIPGLENWLEEQAKKGLFPLWVTGDFTRFERREAVPAPRFRLEAANDRDLVEPERLELYQEAGWQYVGKISFLYFLFYTFDPAAPELHTDLVTRGISLEWLARMVKTLRTKNRLGRLITLAALVLAVVVICYRDVRRLPLFLFDASWVLLILLPLFFLSWREEELDSRRLLDLQRSLELGITPKPSRPRRWSFHSIPFWISIPLAVFALVLFFGGLSGWSLKSTPLERFSGAYVNLQQLESEPLVTYEELFGQEPHHDWDDNTAARQFSLLAPNYYEVEQNLFSLQPGTKQNYFSSSGDPECRYSPTLKAVYFHLLIPVLARPIALSQMAEQEAVNLTWTYEEAEYPGLDFVILSRSNSQYQGAALARGGHLAVFHYGGREDLAEHLDVLAAAVQ